MKDKVLIGSKVKTRQLWADNAKGIAILLVILGHLSLANAEIRVFIYCFHLHVFFFISGYFMSGYNLPIKDFLLKNFKQLIVPLWFLGIIGMPVNWASIYVHPELYGYPTLIDLTWKPFVGLLIGTDTPTSFSFFFNGALWFLMALFVIKHLFYLNNKIENWYVKSFVGISLSIVLFYGLKSLGHWMEIVPFSLVPAMLAYPCFLIGTFARELNIVAFFLDLKVVYKVSIMIALFFILIVSSSWNGAVGFDESAYGKSMIVFNMNGILGTMATIIASSMIGNRSLLSYFGEHSLQILGLHPWSLLLVRSSFYLFFGISFQNYSISVALIMMLLSALLLLPVITYLNKKCPKLIGKWK